MQNTLSDILTAEQAEQADLDAIQKGVGTLVSTQASDQALIKQLQDQIASGNTEPADLQQIADGLQKNRDTTGPIIAALAATAAPAATAPASTGTAASTAPADGSSAPVTGTDSGTGAGSGAA